MHVMEGVRALFDVSAYLLCEASGDSEAQCFGGAAAEAESGGGAAAEDDAQSCSYGSRACGGGLGGGGADFKCDGRGKEVEDDGGGDSDDDEEEDGVVDQWCGGAKEAPPSEVGEDTNVKLMNDEEETDRLFWETCLAS